jgi:uncharacterized protein YggU (UPF0235/DUF167 family)
MSILTPQLDQAMRVTRDPVKGSASRHLTVRVASTLGLKGQARNGSVSATSIKLCVPYRHSPSRKGRAGEEVHTFLKQA